MASLASPAASAATHIERLRQQLCAVEATSFGEGGASLALGIPAIDDALGGGLIRGALHEIAAVCEPESAAATGFALAFATRSNDRSKTVVWIAEDLSLAENGALYGPGLDEAGIAPERLITIAATRARDVLLAMEEALRCGAVGVVIGEVRAHDVDQVAMRRLSLAAATGNALGLFLRTAPNDDHSAAVTRWIIGAAPSACQTGRGRDIGPPRFAARLVRNRRGHLGTWIVEWNSVEQRFQLATNSEPLAGPAFDRPHRAAVA